jgi:hypothetical protein
MKMLAYGEDALTLWALNKKLSFILQKLNDDSPPDECLVIYRPSFGRKGGKLSPQFGEFDFIILAKENLFLGESKWDGSSERIQHGSLTLRKEQLIRHGLFRFYIREWISGSHENWSDFAHKASEHLVETHITKPIAPANRLLTKNLETILAKINDHYSSNILRVRNVLLYFHDNADLEHIPKVAGNDLETFEVIDINYSDIVLDNFIELDMKT